VKIIASIERNIHRSRDLIEIRDVETAERYVVKTSSVGRLVRLSEKTGYKGSGILYEFEVDVDGQ